MAGSVPSGWMQELRQCRAVDKPSNVDAVKPQNAPASGTPLSRANTGQWRLSLSEVHLRREFYDAALQSV